MGFGKIWLSKAKELTSFGKGGGVVHGLRLGGLKYISGSSIQFHLKIDFIDSLDKELVCRLRVIPCKQTLVEIINRDLVRLVMGTHAQFFAASPCLLRQALIF